MSSKREGEVVSARDPASAAADAHLIFIGHINSPWKTRAECPKNLRQARLKNPQGCKVTIAADWRKGLQGLEKGQWVHLLYWMHEARRDLIVQAPKHRDGPAGVFSLRSPVRPNPVAMALVQITSIDEHNGVLGIDATDALDGTPVVDIKPHIVSIDTDPTT